MGEKTVVCKCITMVERAHILIEYIYEFFWNQVL